MGSKISLFKLGVRFSLAAALLVGCFAAAVMHVYAATTMVQISGSVHNALGESVAGVAVYATAPSDSSAIYGPVSTDEDGAYSFEVAYKATYDIHFDPASESNLQPYTEANFAVVRANRQLDANLQTAQTYTFSGIVRDAQGTPVEGIEVRTNSMTGGTESVTTDSNGAFSATRSSDTYTVTLAKTDSSAAGAYPFFEITQSAVDLTGSDVNQDYQLPGLGQASVTVHDRFGGLSPNQEVSFSNGGLESFTAMTDQDGIALIPFLLDTAMAEGSFCTTFSNTNDTVCSSEAYDGTANVALSLDAPLKAIFSGTVTDGDNQPANDIHVILTAQADGSTLEATTDASGNYQIVGTPGLYDVALSTADSSKTTLKHWSSFTLSQGSVDLSADVSQSYQLPAIHSLQVTVTGHDNTTLRLDIDPSDSYVQNASNTTSSATFVVMEGQTVAAGALCATYNASNAGTVCNDQAMIVSNADLTYTFTAPEMYTFSGQILNVDGTPAKGKGAKLVLDDGLTVQTLGKTAAFSIRLTPGTYTVHVLATGIYQDAGTVDIIDTDVSQTYQLEQ